ncbi:MAG: YraN family protein [Oscillospiraceae bacterium]|nr:YraN family protein [Oscillospiraceae bacterium]
MTFLKNKHSNTHKTAAKQRGNLGEALALEHLKENGYHFIVQGFRSRVGEIDLIVENRDHIVFVEVKLRKNAHFANACEYVNKTKQNKIKNTAKLWLAAHRTDLQPRFDVIEIYMEDNAANPKIIHLENAF